MLAIEIAQFGENVHELTKLEWKQVRSEMIFRKLKASSRNTGTYRIEMVM